MAFEFVENDKIDATSRKRIRSHVMKGKNAGKTRRRQTTQDDSVSSTCDSSSTEKSGSSSPDESTDRWVKILRPLGDELAYFSFPAPIDRFARNLITEFMYVQLQWIYPKEFCLSMDYIRGTWFSYIQMSETFLHASQLMATISLDGLRGKDLTSPKALHHLANTYRCFNRDLQLRRTPTDADMAVVVSLAVHGNLEASFGVSKVHLEALNRMLELRGGIEEFSTNWVLWHKFCRSDIDRALHEGCDTLFYRTSLPKRAIADTESALRYVSRTPSPFLEQLSIDPALRDVSNDVTIFCALLNKNPAHFGLKPYAFQGALVLFAYKLLQVYPLNEPPDTDLNDAFYLSHLGLLTSLLFESGMIHTRGYDLLASRSRAAISGLMASLQLKEQPVFLWVLFTSGISICDLEDRTWLYPCIRSCASALNLKSWENAREIIGQFPWVNVVHDRLGSQLWKAAFLNVDG